MEANINFPELIAKNYSLTELRKKAVQSLVLMEYLQEKISKRKAAELLGLNYEGIAELLQQLNIPSQMDLPDDLDKASKQSMEKLAGNLGISLK